MFNTQILAGSSGQGGGVAQQSLKFNDDESQYLSWTPAAAGNRTTWTWSGWVKRGNLGGTQAIFSTVTTNDVIYFDSSNSLTFYTTGNYYSIPPTFFRDTSAWYHFVFVWDTTNVTQADRIRVYVNGERLAFGTGTQAALNATSGFNNNVVHGIGYAPYVGSYYFDGYLSNIHFIDGQALDPTSFGKFTNGYWEKKDYAGSYGTNGFHLTFEDDVVSEGFNAVTYKGIGTKQSISGLGFSPDLVWGKQRSGANSHEIYDTVRGAQQILYSDLTDAEGANINGVSSFDADGYTVAGNTSINLTGNSVVAWAWDAGENNAPTGHSSVTYTGNGGTQSIKGFGFSPDLVWIKTRQAESHGLWDSVRGAPLNLSTNNTNAENSYTGVTSFDSDGFSVGGAYAGYTESGKTYVAWGWDAGNGSPVSNTDGSITSTVKASQANGFSIVSYTGTGSAGTIGHSLGVQPSMIIVKNRIDARNWSVWHKDLSSNDHYLRLDSTDAQASAGANYWNSTAPTSSVFSVGTEGDINDPNDAMIAYCFAEVAGYSKIGSYSGTDSAGVTVTTGFRPGFVMIKATNLVEGWAIIDGSRDTLNPRNKVLKPNSSNAEVSGSQFDIEFTDTGFILNGTDDVINGYSGGTGEYIYMAFKGSYADYVSDYNTDGTIDSRVKANPATGFSITSFVGNGTLNATVGHGLSSTPEMVLVKNRSTAVSWLAWHKDLSGSTYRIDLNGDGAEYNDGNGALQGVSSSLITLGSLNAVNQNSANMICYAFHSVAGYSDIGSYTGTGALGNTVTTGFRPGFVMVKRTDGGGNWVMYDSTRATSNPINKLLYANLSNAEATWGSGGVDFNATGFQVKNSGGDMNVNGGTYIYMAFADTREAAFWKDVSGQGNHWTPNNLDYRDSLPDSPANNFATFNPLVRRSDVTTLPTFSEGNLKAVFPNAGGNVTYAAGTIPITSGKWYYETKIDSLTTNNVVVGWCTEDEIAGSSSHVMIYSATGGIYIDGSLQSTEGALSVGDIIGTTIDLDNGYVGFYKNGTALSVSPSISITSASWWNSGKFLFAWNRGSTSDGTSANFGQDSTFAGAKPMGAYTDDSELGTFQYQPPVGFKSLCSANLPQPTIIDGSEYFNTVLFNANNSTQSITGVGFQPDWVWTKSRDNAYHHGLYDSVRGVNLRLRSSTTDAEVSQSNMLNSFDADGFSLGQNDDANYLGSSVAWNWKAGGTAVSNTDGSITSQVSANVDAGFSVLTFNGTGANATVGHGLGVAPSMVIMKQRNNSGFQWPVYHSSLGTDKFLFLQRTDGQFTSTAIWQNTAPSSSVIYLGANGNDNNNTGSNMVAYCFADVEGFSKAGSYTGNGSTDGTFVYTGFRPAWVMVKWSNGSQDWTLFDNKRPGFNETDKYLHPSSSAAEGDYDTLEVDLLSNGFKCRGPYNHINTSGGSYIYLAFAETPLKFATAR